MKHAPSRLRTILIALSALLVLGGAGWLSALSLSAAQAAAGGSLVASFTWSPAFPAAGQAVTFDGSGSICSGGFGSNGRCSYRYTDQANGSVLGTSVISSFTFQGTGTKYVQLAVTNAKGKTAVVEHDVIVGPQPSPSPSATSPSPSPTTTSPSPSPTMTSPSPSPTMTSPSPSPTTSSPPPPGPLTWSPPACGGSDGLTCTTINLAASGSQNPSLAPNVDYKLIMPGTPITGGTLTISGGHNVQIIGGEIDLVNPCSDSCGAQADGAIYITDGNPGEVYLEGVWIHNTRTAADTASSCPGGGMSCSTADGIDLNVGNGGNPANPPSVVLQNIRIDGISGCSGGSDHADGYQPYNGGTSTSFIDHMTITTNCQGEELDPDYGYAHYGTKPNYVLKNVNVDVLNNPYKGNTDEYGYYLTGTGSGCPSGSVSLSNVYEQEPDGSLGNGFAVWPDTSGTSCNSAYNTASGVLSFPASPQITGVLTNGLPPGGDFVPAGTAGIGYVSPGYQ